LKRKRSAVSEGSSYKFSDESDEKSQQLSFDLEDLSSLENANIDQNLVENHMLLRVQQQKESMKDIIEYHSKLFGYIQTNCIQMYM
jgi:hypothetical protein